MHGKHAEWGGRRGAPSMPLPMPGTWVRHPTTAIGMGSPRQEPGPRSIPVENQGAIGTEPLSCQIAVHFSPFFFFFLKSLHLFSFCPRAPAGVFILAGCWVIYLLALLSPLAGVFQVGSLNSSEPRARGGARWVVLISNTLPKKRRVLFPMFAAAVFVQRGADAPARGDAVGRSRGAGVAVSALGLSSPSRKAAVSTSAGTVRGTSASLGVLRHPLVSLNVP